MNKKMFPTASAANKAAIDSLENALNLQYQGEADAETLNRSVTYGKAIAQIVFDWSETDGYLHASDPYTPPAGPGLWERTPPAFANAATPYWGNNRTIVPGSIESTQPGPPVSYSTDPSSDFYKMVKELYDASQTLTPEQKILALFWGDGNISGVGHFVNILKQILQSENSALDEAVIAYALTGIATNEAFIACWKTKYTYNLLRPVTYIRTVLGNTTWLSFINTPAHPEYPSTQAVVAKAFSGAMTNLFGENYNFTDHSLDFLGFAPRSYSSFDAMSQDAGHSRFYGGIHFLPSIEIAYVQGSKVAENIINQLKFLKE
jgi:hypothetical protein